METKTKLELGHSIYFMNGNKVTSGKIISIKTISELVDPLSNSLDSRTHIVYLADVLGEDKYIEVKLEINEEFAFETKEKLLESLWKNI